MGQQLSKCLPCGGGGGARRSVSKESLVDSQGVMMKQMPLHTSPVLNNALRAYLEDLQSQGKITEQKRTYVLKQLENIANHRQVKQLLEATKEPPELRQRLIECLTHANLGHLVEYVTKPPPANDATRMAEIKLLMANHYDMVAEKRSSWYPGEKSLHLEDMNIYQTGNSAPLSSYLEMFQFVTSPVRILIQGECGIGKTTFLRGVARDWGRNVLYHKRKSTISDEEVAENQRDGLNTFDVVLMLDLTLLCDDSSEVLKKLVHSQLNFLGYSDRQFVIDYMFKYPERLLLLLDNIDFCQSSEILQIIDGSALDGSCCMFTGNGLGMECDFLVQKYEIHGFTNEQVANLTKQFAADISSQNDEMLSSLRKDLKYDESAEPLELAPKLLRVPVLLHTMCVSWKNHEDCPHSWTKCCKQLLIQLLKMHNSRKKKLVAEDSLLQEYQSHLSKIGELAFNVITCNPHLFTFNLNELKETYHLLDESLELGILVGSTESTPLQSDKYVTFSHSFLVNFLSAYYLATHKNSKEMQEKAEILINSNYFSNIIYQKHVLGFTCGLNPSTGNYVLTECVKKFDNQVESFHSKDITDLLLFCLTEYSDSSTANTPLPSKLVYKISPDNLSYVELMCRKNKKEGKVKTVHVEIAPQVPVTDTHLVVGNVIQQLASASLQELHMEWRSNLSHEAYKQLYKCVKTMKNLTSFSLQLHHKHKKEHFFRSLLDHLSHLEYLANINVNFV